MVKYVGEKTKHIRLGKYPEYEWVSLKSGDEVPSNFVNRFEADELIDLPVVEEVVEDLEEDIVNFRKELRSIKGVGAKTVNDILALYPTRAELIKKLGVDEVIPLRDDVVEKLYDYYMSS